MLIGAFFDSPTYPNIEGHLRTFPYLFVFFQIGSNSKKTKKNKKNKKKNHMHLKYKWKPIGLNLICMTPWYDKKYKCLIRVGVFDVLSNSSHIVLMFF